MGALTNNGRKLACFTGFYKGIQSAGGAISPQLDSNNVSFLAQFATNWGLLAGSLVIAAPVIWTKVKEALSDIRTWSSLFYMLLMLPLGIAYFVIGVVGLSLSLGVTAGSLYSLATGESHIQISDAPVLEHVLHTAPGLIVLAVVGVLLFFLVLHVARAIGWVHGKIAEGLLVRL